MPKCKTKIFIESQLVMTMIWLLSLCGNKVRYVLLTDSNKKFELSKRSAKHISLFIKTPILKKVSIEYNTNDYSWFEL